VLAIRPGVVVDVVREADDDVPRRAGAPGLGVDGQVGRAEVGVPFVGEPEPQAVVGDVLRIQAPFPAPV